MVEALSIVMAANNQTPLIINNPNDEVTLGNPQNEGEPSITKSKQDQIDDLNEQVDESASVAAEAAERAVVECEAFRVEAKNKFDEIEILKEAIEEHASNADKKEQICLDSKNDANTLYFSRINRERDLDVLETRLEEVEEFADAAT